MYHCCCCQIGTLVALCHYFNSDQFVRSEFTKPFEAYVVSYAFAGAQWLIDTPSMQRPSLPDFDSLIPVCDLSSPFAFLKLLAPVELQHDAWVMS